MATSTASAHVNCSICRTSASPFSGLVSDAKHGWVSGVGPDEHSIVGSRRSERRRILRTMLAKSDSVVGRDRRRGELRGACVCCCGRLGVDLDVVERDVLVDAIGGAGWREEASDEGTWMRRRCAQMKWRACNVVGECACRRQRGNLPSGISTALKLGTDIALSVLYYFFGIKACPLLCHISRFLCLLQAALFRHAKVAAGL